MSKISTYEVTPVPKLADKLIGTSVGGEIEDITYNFTLSELLNLFIPNIPANTLQGVLDYGNEATQDIILHGTIYTTNLEVSGSINLVDTYLNGETHVLGGLYDSLDSAGTAGQVLRSTGEGVEWYTIPTIIPTLQQVLASGNTADINIVLTANVQAVTVAANNVVSNTSLSVVGNLKDKDASTGTAGQILSSTGTKVQWVDLPIYAATSPLHIDNITKTISIQQANSTQDGYLSSTDWITFSGKQDAISLTTTGSSGPATLVGTTINVPNYTLSGLGGVPLTRTLTINGVTYNLSADRSWTIAAGVSSVTATSPLFSTGGVNPDISIQQAGSSLDGYLSSADWLMFNAKQDAGNYITSLTGEASGVGPGAASVTLSNAAVIGKLLTGLNITGGTVVATDSILTAFGKVQNQINSLVGGVIYKGVWNASTNTPTLTSSVGTQGNYYIVSVAGNTNLNGITDWNVGDWAIFNGSTWNKVDNTDAVTSVNGQTGAVSLTTDNIPEGTTNLYYLNSRARAALSFAAGSGAYNSTTGVITIPTNTNQLTNGAAFITLGSLSASSPLNYNNLTGAFSIQVANGTQDGYLSSTDWNTFNSKQPFLNGTGLVKSTAGAITYITDNSTNWNTAYDNMIVSAAVTGTSTKTLTLTQQDAGTITASWTDNGLTSVGVSMPSAFSVANSPLTSNGTIAVTGAGTSLQYIDGTGALQTFPTIANEAATLVTEVYNETGATLTKGTVVYINGGHGNLPTVTKALATSDATSAQTYGVVQVDITNMNSGHVVVIGSLGDLDTQAYPNGTQLYLSSTTAGAWTSVKQYAPAHLVYVGIVVRSHPTQGIVEVKIQNGFEMDELHNVYAQNPNNNAILQYKTSTSLWTSVDGTTTNIAEGTNLYYLDSRARAALSFTPGSGAYNSTTGVITIPTNTNQLTNGAAFITLGSLSATAPLSYNNLTGAFSISQASATTNGYLSSTDWNTFNSKQEVISLTTTGSSGASTLVGTTLNVPNYTLSGLGGVPTSRTLNINGTSYDLSTDRSWSVGTVTSVAALTLGTTGTDLSSTVATGSTTPVITLNVPTASAVNRGALSAADWSTFNTKVGGVTASSPLSSSGGQTPNITIQVASGTQNGYLSSTDWTTFNNKQAAGNYITSLTGEATASGPGAASVTLSNSAVTAKVLTGINITGGTVLATDSILTGFGKLQNQINGLIGSTIYQGTWNASTNTPTLTSSVGTRGWYYIVNVAGTTNLNGITDWQVGDWAIFDGTAWQKVDNTDAVVSVNGQTGAVSLTTDNIPEGLTNLYFTNARARGALSFAAGSGAYNSTTGVITIPTNTNQLTNGASFITLASLSGTAPIQYNNTTGAISITQSGTASNGFLSSTDWNTFNNKQNALTNPVTASAPWTSNYIPKINGTYTITNSLLYDGGSSIGVNTNSPYDSTQFKLDVNGGLLVKNTSGTAAQFVLIDANPASGGNAGFFIQTVGGTSTGAWAQIQTYYGTSIAAGALRLQPSTGQILVGTTATSAFKVDINGTLRVTGQLTLGSTITDGTNVYTLPSSTGTLALTSALSSYVPYTGATSAVNLNTQTLTVGGITTSANLLIKGNSTILQLNDTSNSLDYKWWVGQNVSGTNDGIFYIFNATTAKQQININQSNVISFPQYTSAGVLRVNSSGTMSSTASTSSNFVMGDGSLVATSTYLTTTAAASTYLALAGGIMTGQIVLAAGTTSTDYTKGLRFPNDPYGGTGDTSGLRLYADTSTGAEAQVLELYVTNDVPGVSVDKINFAAPTNDLVTINGNKIWNAGNLTPQSAITLTTTGTSGAATLVGATLNIPQYQSVLTNPVTGVGSTNRIPKFTGASTIGDSVIFDNGTNMSVGSAASTRSTLTDNGQFHSYYASETLPRVEINRDLLGGGLSGIGFTDRDATFATWGVAVGLSAARELGFFVSNGTSLVKQAYIVSSGAATFNSSVTAASFAVGQVLITSNQIYRNSSSEFYVNYSGTGNTMVGNGTGNVSINAGTNPAYRLDVGGTGQFTLADGSGARTSPINILTITAENPSNPYNGFGGGLLFKNRIYAGGPSPGGIRDGARIRASINTNSSVNDGTDLVFDTTTTGDGALTETVRFSYIYGHTFKSSTYNVASFNSTYGQSNIVIQNNGASFAVFGSGVSVCSTAGASDVGIGTAGGNTSIVFATGSGYTEKMRLTNGGSLGIGNTSPQARLDLGGGYGASGEKFLIYNDNNASALAGTKVGFYMDRFGLSNNSTFVFPTISGAPGSYIIASKDTGGTTLVARVTVLGQSGNVGIANTSPITKLHVNNSVSGAILPYINATSLSYNNDGISVAGTNSDNTNIGNGITFYNNAAAVGTYGPVIAWSSMTSGGAYNSTYGFITGVYNGTGGDTNWAAGSIIFGTANSYGAQERMRLNRVGFLGIGSDNPTATLHVVDGSYNRFTVRVQSAAANIANAYGGIGLSGEGSNTKGGIFFQSIGQSYSRGNMIFSLNNSLDQSDATPSDAVMSLMTNTKNVLIGTSSDNGFRVNVTTASGGLYVQNSSNTDNIDSIITYTGYTKAAFVASVADSPSLNGFLYYGQAAGTKTYAVYPNGNVQNTNGSYGTLSDIRIKQNIVDATPKLENLLKVRIVNYNLISPYSQEKQIGVVAQELEKIFPSMVYSDMEGIKGVKYSIFTPMIIKAIQEQDEIIKTQGILINELKKEIQLLKEK